MGDTMYLHQAMAQSDKRQFIKAMVKHWVITLIKEVPKGTTILDSVWTMRRKEQEKQVSIKLD